MSRCPFWSTTIEKIECYKECPMLAGGSSEAKDGQQCIFNECSESSVSSFRDIIKEDYSFMNLSMYEDDKIMKINY